MNKKMMLGVAAFAAAVTFSATAENADVKIAEEEDSGAVGYSAIAISLASPVQLPWGIGEWDIYGLDLGIFYNDICEMYGLQVGLANTARGDEIGLVAGGVFNYANRDVYGFRAVLGANICNKTVYGLDAGGFAMHRSIYGADISFLGSMNEMACGVLVSGIFNLCEKESHGVTIAGGVNLAKVAKGVQLAGIFNQTDELHGCQIGVVNFARECPWGFQIGLVNIIMDNSVKVLPIVNAYF